MLFYWWLCWWLTPNLLTHLAFSTRAPACLPVSSEEVRIARWFPPHCCVHSVRHALTITKQVLRVSGFHVCFSEKPVFTSCGSDTKHKEGDRQNATLEGKGGAAWLRDDITELSIQLVRLHKRCFVLHEIKVPFKQMHKWNLKSHNLHNTQDNNCGSFHYTFPTATSPRFLLSEWKQSSQHLKLKLTQCRPSPAKLPDFPSLLSECFTSDIIRLQDAVTAGTDV